MNLGVFPDASEGTGEEDDEEAGNASEEDEEDEEDEDGQPPLSFGLFCTLESPLETSKEETCPPRLPLSPHRDILTLFLKHLRWHCLKGCCRCCCHFRTQIFLFLLFHK